MCDNKVQRAWEERVISRDKGNRVVHYLIRDTNANSILAVVGIERSIKHMTYSVTEDFLRVFGSTSAVHAGTRWHSRKDAVECLKSVVKGGGSIFDNSNPEITPHLKVLMAMMTRFSKRKNLQNEQIKGSSNYSDIVWLGDALICTKQLKHYSAFVRNGSKIPVYSFVWITSAKKIDYLGYVEDMYEEKHGKKMVKVRWIVHPEEIARWVRNLCPEPREVFFTPKGQEISAECIDGIAAILTPSDFKKWGGFVSQDLSFERFMCHREFRNNEVKSFSLSKLRGYSTQPILYTLMCEVNRQNNNRGKSTRQGSVAGQTFSAVPKFSDKPVAKGGPSCQRKEVKLPGEKPTENTPGSPAKQQTQSRWLPKIGANIELLCQDSGMRGCWLRCKILRISRNDCMKVQYLDVDEVDGPGKLEEWVPVSRVAAPDSAGMRCAERLTVRPWPDWDSTDFSYEFGMAADTWCHDGWWECIVLGLDTNKASGYQVFFPGEKKFETVSRKHMRVSKDFVGNKWVSIEQKTDILAFLTESLNPIITTTPLRVVAGQAYNSVPPTNAEVPSFSESRDGKVNHKDADELNLKKQLALRENEDSSKKSANDDDKHSTKGKTVNRSRMDGLQWVLALEAPP